MATQFNGLNMVPALSNKKERLIEKEANRLKFVNIAGDKMSVTTVTFKADEKDVFQNDVIVSYRVYDANLKKSEGGRAGSGYARVGENGIVNSVVIIKDKSDEFLMAVKAAHMAKKEHARAYTFARKQASAGEKIVGYSELIFTEAKSFMARMARAKVRAANPLNDLDDVKFAALEAEQLALIEAMIAMETN